MGSVVKLIFILVAQKSSGGKLQRQMFIAGGRSWKFFRKWRWILGGGGVETRCQEEQSSMTFRTVSVPVNYVNSVDLVKLIAFLKREQFSLYSWVWSLISPACQEDWSPRWFSFLVMQTFAGFPQGLLSLFVCGCSVSQDLRCTCTSPYTVWHCHSS